MDIMPIRDRAIFGILVIAVTFYLSVVESLAIFKIKTSSQPKECSSFVNHSNHSIADPTVFHPPEKSIQVNYEYAITTPNFPKNYPTNLQCISIIKAPAKDYKIVIEVRENFELEPTKDCLTDFLEINDGPFGFSNRIGKFCSPEMMPKEIISSGPFLWLRFFSDSSLPHSGFKIVYRFIRQTVIPKFHYCYKQTEIPDDDSFNLNTSFLLSQFKNSTNSDDIASIPVECVFDFYVNSEFTIFIHKDRFIKQKNPLPCEDSFMEIYHKSTVNEDVVRRKYSNYHKICQDEDFVEGHFTKSYRTSVRIFIKDLSKINDISFIITPMKEYKNKCPDNYLPCFNTWCIPNKLICNNEVNCPSQTDENCLSGRMLKPGEEQISNATIESKPTRKPKEIEEDIARRNTNKTHAMILSTITVILILCMVVCLVITIHSKKKDRSKNRIHLNEFESNNQVSTQSKRLFYERLNSSEPIVTSFSTEKLSRKSYANNSIWSKRIVTDDTLTSGNRIDDSILKLNGGITANTAIKTFSHKAPKLKNEKMKNTSMNKIGKYLSVPNPSKNDCTQNSINSNQFSNQIQSFGVISPSEDFQSISSQSYSKQNSSTNKSIYQHIQRASSMGSGLRKQLLEPMKNNQYTKNIEWYCGPVIRGSSVESSTRNDSSDMLNAYSAKSSTHVPGCRSLPNVNYMGLQNQVYYTKPIPVSSVNQDITDSLDFSYDDNSSYKDETVSVKNHYVRDNSHKQFESKKNNDDFSSNYGFKYFCAHEPSRSKDFVEYIA